jgi:hypothetical protein
LAFSVASCGWMNPGISAEGSAPGTILAEKRVLERLRILTLAIGPMNPGGIEASMNVKS